MTGLEWLEFFEFMSRVVHDEGMSASEKGQHVKDMAIEHGDVTDLGEFLAMMSDVCLDEDDEDDEDA